MSSQNQALADLHPGAILEMDWRHQGVMGRRQTAAPALAGIEGGTAETVMRALQEVHDRQVELELRNEELLLMKQRAFDAAISANSIATPGGALSDVNETFLRRWGYPDREEVLGKPISHFFMHRGEAATILAILDDMGYWEGEFTAKRKDGTAFVAHGLATVVCDGKGKFVGYQSAVMDVTEHRQAERTLRDLNASLEQRVFTRTLKLNQSEGRFRLLAEATFEGIAISEGGILLDANCQLAACLGYELAELVARPVMDFIAPESRALFSERIGMGEGSSDECFGLRKDGSTFPLAIHARMGTWQGKVTQIAVLRDLSEAKQAAAALHAQHTELEHVLRLALVSEVSAGIIHQLCQPLSAMGANIAAIIAHLEACGARACGSLPIIKDVETDVARMREIVTHLREIAKPGPASREGLDLNAIVTAALPLLRQKAGNFRCRLVSDLGRNLPPVCVDAVQIRQVIYNMVHNAFEACSGYPKERRVVVLSTRALDGERVEMYVRDAGTGIAPETMDRLFKTFLSTKADGLGVGLRLCRTIVEAHGGSIQGYNNAEGDGATFRVVLPAHQAQPDTQTPTERNL